MVANCQNSDGMLRAQPLTSIRSGSELENASSNDANKATNLQEQQQCWGHTKEPMAPQSKVLREPSARGSNQDESLCEHHES